MINEIKYYQNLCDLGYIIEKLAGIIDKKELNEQEKRDLRYCEKVIKQVNEKIKEKA